ncbi:MAG TPA: hypothetical protein VNE82_04750 [Candidatus Binataceae bacterium]|nr:hypothetical protein [Candidatus Binataceae bacterium]
MSVMLRFFFLVGLLGFAAVFRLPEIRLLGLIVVDYASFCVLYRLAQKRNARNFAKDCRELIDTYNVGDELAKKLTSYWATGRR